MHAIVLGAGVVGVTTAYYLAERGYRVTVIDRAVDVACETSHANGGQLSYSFTESLARPDFLNRMPSLIAGQDAAIQVHLRPELLGWGMRFLSQCRSERCRENSLALLQMGAQSARLMTDLRKVVDFDFSFRAAGKLVLLANDDEIRTAERTTRLKQEHGCDITLFSVDEAIAVEPALDAFDEPFKAAIYSAGDEVADARRFGAGMRAFLEHNFDVEFRLGTTAQQLIHTNGRVAGVRCDESLLADVVVICLGIWSRDLLKSVGVNPHIYPVRGYSVTLPLGEATPDVSLTSLKNSFVFSRLNGSMRIAGFADFDGRRSTRDDDRIATLLTTARRIAPHAADYDSEEKHPWGGFRPMTPSARPLVGRTIVDGLYLNTGHGMLGWTLACATAKNCADAVSGTNG